MYFKIKINKINNLFWYYPSIYNFSKSQWSSRPFNSLKDLFTYNKLHDYEARLTVNPDCALETFNFCQLQNKYNFILDENIFKNIDKKSYFEDKITDDLIIVWNYKSLAKIKRGYIPFITKKNLIDNFSNLNSNSFRKKIIWLGKFYDWYKN